MAEHQFPPPEHQKTELERFNRRSAPLYSRVRFTREAFDVERCHTHPHVLRYSVGHHSAGVVALIIQTWLEAHGELPRAELMAEALYHDAPELVVGDIPSPVKHLMGEELEQAEDKALSWLLPWPAREHRPGSNALTDKERWWLDAADAVELFLWCLEEAYMRGNKTFDPWITYYRNKWIEDPSLLPMTFHNIVEQASLKVMIRMPWSELKEVAGL